MDERLGFQVYKSRPSGAVHSPERCPLLTGAGAPRRESGTHVTWAKQMWGMFQNLKNQWWRQYPRGMWSEGGASNSGSRLQTSNGYDLGVWASGHARQHHGQLLAPWPPPSWACASCPLLRDGRRAAGFSPPGFLRVGGWGSERLFCFLVLFVPFIPSWYTSLKKLWVSYLSIYNPCCYTNVNLLFFPRRTLRCLG